MRFCSRVGPVGFSPVVDKRRRLPRSVGSYDGVNIALFLAVTLRSRCVRGASAVSQTDAGHIFRRHPPSVTICVILIPTIPNAYPNDAVRLVQSPRAARPSGSAWRHARPSVESFYNPSVRSFVTTWHQALYKKGATTCKTISQRAHVRRACDKNGVSCHGQKPRV